ncbi:MAG TPA: DUF5301 domain-containing protein [Bacillus sp. (in: firmicutes)]|nr:DUF5301 domain-containing protein [Bacillus sp. (in: firmicutes)]
MKKKILGISITSVIVILGSFYLYTSRNGTTFNEIVLDTTEVTSVEIVRSSDDKKVVLKDENDINFFIKSLSEAELKENKIKEDFDESYWLVLRTNGERKIGMTIYDEKFLLLYDYETNKQTSYQIVRGFHSSNIAKFLN